MHHVKMAPRRKSVNTLRASTSDFSRKENVYLRSLSDYQARVRRRDTMRNSNNTLESSDLEEKIDFEMKMWEASTRLLAASRQPDQAIEAARALLVSKERMTAYMAELHGRKKVSTNKITKGSENLPSRGRLSLSDLRLPLMWRETDHFKNRGDQRKFAVFCLARVGSEIHDTSLVCPLDREQTDITLPDSLLFHNVPAEFELTLEIYAHLLQEEFCISGARRRLRRSIHSSISRTMGKKWASSAREEQDLPKTQGPRFELVAFAKLNLDHTSSNISTHDLVLNNSVNKQRTPPLFGYFCCCLAVQPDCLLQEACVGHIRLNGQHCWARLDHFSLRVWQSRAHVNDECGTICDIPVDKNTELQQTDKELRIINTGGDPSSITNQHCSLLDFETSENAQLWFSRITTLAKEHSRWKHAITQPQELKAPTVPTSRNPFVDLPQPSLYDEIPVISTNGK